VKKRRLGKFSVASGFADLENIAMRSLMEKIVVIRAEYDYCADRFEYTALCDDFAICEPGMIVPEYTVRVSGDPAQISFVRSE
jgi:hypothetical protein